MVTGMRGLCNGLGPAMYGVIFYLFNVDLNEEPSTDLRQNVDSTWYHVPGPPFVFGGFMVILAILVAIFIPEVHGPSNVKAPSEKKRILTIRS